MSQASDIAKEIERLSSRVTAKIALDVSANVKEDTPVNTGWARANWVPGIGAPPDSTAETVKTPTTQQAAAQQTAQQAAEALIATTYRVTSGKIYVSNGVRYISELNDGSSRQAPRGFVQQGIKKAITQDIKGFKG